MTDTTRELERLWKIEQDYIRLKKETVEKVEKLKEEIRDTIKHTECSLISRKIVDKIFKEKTE